MCDVKLHKHPPAFFGQNVAFLIPAHLGSRLNLSRELIEEDHPENELFYRRSIALYATKFYWDSTALQLPTLGKRLLQLDRTIHTSYSRWTWPFSDLGNDIATPTELNSLPLRPSYDSTTDFSKFSYWIVRVMSGNKVVIRVLLWRQPKVVEQKVSWSDPVSLVNREWCRRSPASFHTGVLGGLLS